MSPATKICPGCPSRGEQPSANFWKNRTAKDGLQRCCRACLSEMQAESAARSTMRWAERIGMAATFGVWLVGVQMLAAAVQP